jgi:cobalt-zinc-cadmium efflux system membrane fusion protein
MQRQSPVTRRVAVWGAAAVCGLGALGAVLYASLGTRAADAAAPPAAAVGATAATASPPPPSVKLTDAQAQSIQVGSVGERSFDQVEDALGSIDFNEDLEVQVFTPYQGRILQLFAKLGDPVTKGEPLFTLESPDFIQAESNLIAAAGVLDQTASALDRAKKLYPTQGIDQNDYELAVSDQQSAEGALKAAREALKVFGKTDAEIDHIVAVRRVETALVVRSPISGRITARNAAPGLLEQPGNPPAPYSVADVSTVWMLANVTETDIPHVDVGQAVRVTVSAYPGREFQGAITALGANVDPNTHRITVRSEIKDPRHELRPGMLANFVISTGAPLQAPAVPESGVVREGDGTFSVWLTTDRHEFVRRQVKVGLSQDHYDQILDGVRTGDLVAVDGAIFLSNIAFGGAN